MPVPSNSKQLLVEEMKIDAESCILHVTGMLSVCVTLLPGVYGVMLFQGSDFSYNNAQLRPEFTCNLPVI
jgi:hypothetical protein